MRRSVIVLFGLLSTALGHTLLTNVTINGQITNSCIRPYVWGGTPPDFPIADGTKPNGVLSQDYACGWLPGASQAASSSCVVAAGSTIKASYWHGAIQGEDPKEDSFIHNSHRGPFIVSMAKWNRSDGLPTGNAWFKLYQLAIVKDAANFWEIEWASPHVMNKNGGALEFQIPKNLESGRYLVRTEIIALHDTVKQPYVRCIDITVTNGGSIQPSGSALISYPGTIQPTDRGLTYNMYEQDLSKRGTYVVPGPAPYDFSTSSSSPSQSQSPQSSASRTSAQMTSASRTSAQMTSASQSASRSASAMPSATQMSASQSDSNMDSESSEDLVVSSSALVVFSVFALMIGLII